MILRPFLYDETSCASYVFGCLTESRLGVVDPHEALVDKYLEAAESAGDGTPTVEQLAEAARGWLAPAITASCRSADGRVYALTLGHNAERLIADALADAVPGAVAPLPPAEVESLGRQVERVRVHLEAPDAVPCLVCSPEARRSVSAALAEVAPQVRVVSWEELLPEAPVEHLGSVDVARGPEALLPAGAERPGEVPSPARSGQSSSLTRSVPVSSSIP